MITIFRYADNRFFDHTMFMSVTVEVDQPDNKITVDEVADPWAYFNDDDGQLDGYEGGEMKITIHIKGSKMIPIKEFNNMYNDFVIDHQIERTTDLYNDILSEVVRATEI